MTTLLGLAREIGADVVGNNLAQMPVSRREVELLIVGDDAAALRSAGMELCSRAFGTEPVAGVVTYISRGTDDDAHGVLSALGLTGEVVREPADDGYDVVYVTLREADLMGIPESRVHTALEASLNAEVHIRTR